MRNVCKLIDATTSKGLALIKPVPIVITKVKETLLFSVK